MQKTASFYSEDGKTFCFLKLCSISKTILYLFYWSLWSCIFIKFRTVPNFLKKILRSHRWNFPRKHTMSFRCPYNVHNVKTTSHGCQNNVVCVLGYIFKNSEHLQTLDFKKFFLFLKELCFEDLLAITLFFLYSNCSC